MAKKEDRSVRRAERKARRKQKQEPSSQTVERAVIEPVEYTPMEEPVGVELDAAPFTPAPTSFETYDTYEIEGSISEALPTFDDFRRRDEARAFDSGLQAEEPAKRPIGAPQSATEKLMELMSFDSIDERPANEKPYDWTSRVIGQGLPNKAGVYYLPYLQSGHMLLLGGLTLASLISYPGFPLTEVPDEYRAILGQGFAITFLVNAACAAYCRPIAAEKGEPVWFWTAKVFLFGGLALGELTQAVPDLPAKRPRR